MYDAFEAQGLQVIAVAQEDTSLENHGKFHAHFAPAPRFEIVADIGRVATQPYGRTRTYLIDEAGVVRQVFPHLLHHRATWKAVLNESKRVLAEEAPTSRPADD